MRLIKQVSEKNIWLLVLKLVENPHFWLLRMRIEDAHGVMGEEWCVTQQRRLWGCSLPHLVLEKVLFPNGVDQLP